MRKPYILIPLTFGLFIMMMLLIVILLLYRQVFKIVKPDKSKISSDALSTAVYYCDLGLFDESIHTLKYAIYQDPSYSALHANLARAYANKDMFDLAFAELEIALERVGELKKAGSRVTLMVAKLQGDDQTVH